MFGRSQVKVPYTSSDLIIQRCVLSTRNSHHVIGYQRNRMKKLLLLLSACLIFYNACATTETINTAETKPSPFTHGNVQLTLKKGITTQAEVLESFGPPNIATIDKDGNEVWTYQKLRIYYSPLQLHDSRVRQRESPPNLRLNARLAASNSHKVTS